MQKVRNEQPPPTGSPTQQSGRPQSQRSCKAVPGSNWDKESENPSRGLAGREVTKKNKNKKNPPLSQAWDDWGKLPWEKNYLRMIWNSYCGVVLRWCVSLFWLLASPKERIRCSPWVGDGEIQSWGKLAYFPPLPRGRRLTGSRGPKRLFFVFLCASIISQASLLSLSPWRLRDA